MAAFVLGDVVYGGALPYATHITDAGTFVEWIHTLDDEGTEVKPNGGDFDSRGRLFLALGTLDDSGDALPHDVAVIPGDKGLVVAVARGGDTADLRIYTMDGALTTTHTGVDVDAGWNHLTEFLRLAVACDGKTVYYTDEHATIFRYDLSTASQLAPFKVLPGGSPLVYGGLTLVGPDDLVVAESGSGDGPRRAVKRGLAKTIWTDEVEPIGSFHIWKRTFALDTLVTAVVTAIDPSDTNSAAICIATYVPPGCTRRRGGYTWVAS